MGRRAVRVLRTSLTALLYAALVGGGAVASASAAEGGLQVSVDGVTYTSDNTLSLFPESWRFVPGDIETRAAWVRNTASSPALLRIDLIDAATTDPAFAAHLTLAATPSGSAATAVDFADAIAAGGCTVLSGTRVLDAGESARVDVQAAVSIALTELQGQRGDVSFALRATLLDPAAGAARPGDACAAAAPRPEVPGGLPVTGGSVPWTLAAWGALALGGGLFAFVAGRRRRRDDDEEEIGALRPPR